MYIHHIKIITIFVLLSMQIIVGNITVQAMNNDWHIDIEFNGGGWTGRGGYNGRPGSINVDYGNDGWEGGIHLHPPQPRTRSPEEPPKSYPGVPVDFNPDIYISLYPDLQKAAEGKKDKSQWAIKHYMNYGRKEGRAYTQEQYERKNLPVDFNPDTYLSLYPDLQKAAAGEKDKSQWAIHHYMKYGRQEKRAYTHSQPSKL